MHAMLLENAWRRLAAKLLQRRRSCTPEIEAGGDVDLDARSTDGATVRALSTHPTHNFVPKPSPGILA
jgi:hypothetical protein